MSKKEAKILLAALIVLLGIGYAAIRSGLNINGITHVQGNTWDVHFENYQASSGSVTPTTEPSTTGNPTTVTYEVTLTNPGDYYEFTIDAVNNGTMDVMIESFSSKIGNTEITPSTLPPYLSYSATYSDGLALQNKQQLLHGTRETLKLKVAYRDDIPTTDLPSTVQDLSLSFTITYVQKDDSSIPVPHTYNIYRWSTSTWTTNQDISSFTEGTDYVSQESQVTNMDSRASKYYLKYLISNNAVTDKYVAFVISNEMAQANPGMTAGTYYLKGGDSGASYEANKATLLSAFGSSYCSDSSSNFNCIVSGLYADAYSNGNVDASDGSAICGFYGDGSSICYE